MPATDLRQRLDFLLDLEAAQGFLSEADEAEADRIGLELKELQDAERQAEAERNGDHRLARHIRFHRVRRAHIAATPRRSMIRPQASRASRGRSTRVKGSRRVAALPASDSDPPGDPEPARVRLEAGAAA